MIEEIQEKIFEAKRTSTQRIYYKKITEKIYLNIESTKIIYVLEGSVIVRAFGLIRELKAGDLYIMKYMDFYSIESQNEAQVIVLEIYNDFILDNYSIEVLDICRGIILDSMEKDNILIGMSLLLKYKIESTRVNSEVWKVLNNIYDNIQEAPKICDEINKENMSNTKNIIYTILDELPSKIKSEDEVSLQSTSKEYGISYYYLSKKFKEIVKINFNEYILDLKISFLFDNLINTDARITEVGMESGFKSISTVNRLFSNAYGVPPREVRDIQKNLDFKIFLGIKEISDFIDIAKGSEDIYLNEEIVINLTRQQNTESMDRDEIKKRVFRVKNTISSFNNDKIIIILNMQDYYNTYNLEDEELKRFIVRTIKEILEIAMSKQIEITIIQKV